MDCVISIPGKVIILITLHIIRAFIQKKNPINLVVIQFRTYPRSSGQLFLGIIRVQPQLFVANVVVHSVCTVCPESIHKWLPHPGAGLRDVCTSPTYEGHSTILWDSNRILALRSTLQRCVSQHYSHC